MLLFESQILDTLLLSVIIGVAIWSVRRNILDYREAHIEKGRKLRGF